MKLITDTYCKLDGKKRLITQATEIDCSIALAKDIIAKLKADTANSGIEKVLFCKITDEAIKKVKNTFGDVYEGKDDGYIVEVASDIITVYYSTENSIRYAACAIASHYDNGIETGLLYNSPLCEFRAMKVYIPSEKNIGYFKEFIDMCMNFGYNKLVWELGGAMEYKKHPEINEGWIEFCKIFEEYPAKGRDVQNSMPWEKNSIHCENGEGSFLTQETLKELIDYCTERGIEIIPEVPCLSHCDYLLTRHPELAENKNDPVPDTYCPSNPNSYKLLFDVLDEIIALFKPKLIHIGHDEWYTFCVCDKCKGKDPAEIYAEDIKKIMDYLRPQGIDSMIWGEKLLNAVTDDGNTYAGAHRFIKRIISDKTVSYKGNTYPVYRHFEKGVDKEEEASIQEIPATYACAKLVPKDLKIMNWYWNLLAEKSDNVYHENNLWTVFGNFEGSLVKNWFGRIEKGTKGYTISNWSVLDKKYLQRNGLLFEHVYLAFMDWNRDFDETKLTENTIAVSKRLFDYNYKDISKKSHIEIVHSTSVKIPRKWPTFVDGIFMYDDIDRLGYYNIYYEDGTMEKTDIFFGRNIGYTPTNWDGSDEQLDVLFGKEKDVKFGVDGLALQTNCRVNLIEVTASCDYVIKDNKIYYKLLIPTDKKVSKVVPEIFDKYEDKVYIDSIKINSI